MAIDFLFCLSSLFDWTSGTGFASSITPQKNGELAKAGNMATTGFDVVSYKKKKNPRWLSFTYYGKLILFIDGSIDRPLDFPLLDLSTRTSHHLNKARLVLVGIHSVGCLEPMKTQHPVHSYLHSLLLLPNGLHICSWIFRLIDR